MLRLCYACKRYFDEGIAMRRDLAKAIRRRCESARHAIRQLSEIIGQPVDASSLPKAITYTSGRSATFDLRLIEGYLTLVVQRSSRDTRYFVVGEGGLSAEGQHNLRRWLLP